MSFIVNNTTFPGLLDLLDPHSCRGCGTIGEALCHRCKNNIILESSNFCPNCKAINPTGNCSKCKSLPPTFVIGNRTDLIGKLIYDLKFNSTSALARPLAELLHATLPAITGPVVIVPLPTIRRHIRTRGLDHTYLIAKHLARIRGSSYQVSRLLTRTSNTVQVGSSRKARITQANSAYAIRAGATLHPNVTYIIFYDIWTTCASIKAATKLLQKTGAHKIIISLLAVSLINQK